MSFYRTQEFAVLIAELTSDVTSQHVLVCVLLRMYVYMKCVCILHKYLANLTIS